MNLKLQKTILNTSRLYLREIEEKDTDEIVKWRSNPNVYRFFLDPHPLDKEKHLEWYYNRYLVDLNRYDFMACLKDNKKAIGVFGIKRQADNSSVAEISYILAPEEQGKGFASEAVVALTNFVKSSWKCSKVIAEIHCKNYQSIRFINNLGYKFLHKDGEFEIYGKDL